MNYKLFEKVIENINGNIIGVNINSKPEYQEDFKELLKDFNNFTKLICPDNLETINISNRWQNSGNYKKYFWNQYKIIDNNIVDKGYSIWIGISYDGIKIQCPDFRIKSTTCPCFMGFFEKNRHYNLGY